ncbi:type II toxin-antitoxin system CcdA family antitoxin [Cupriavidus sp. a3]|uniref:type II toxin-antitoxin system CcdA family antitoxin n=1 Tax=Cupriavidus sp. a3 TaxID=3242158 RepID=UPI003D9C46F4
MITKNAERSIWTFRRCLNTGCAKRIRLRRGRWWETEKADFIAAPNELVELLGLPLAKHRMF